MQSYPGAFGQVITNLIMNSLTHGFEGRPSGTIKIEAHNIETGWVQLIFSDDGVGIPEAMQHRAFEPFYTTKRGQGGSGLGLHVVFNLVTQTLGGSVKLTSKPENGTKLTIKLPLSSPTNQKES
jgi:two-component system, NtrC family, sensor kinase